MFKKVCSSLLSLTMVLGMLISCFAISASAEGSNVYWQVTGGVLHLGNTSYAGNDSDLVGEEQAWNAVKEDITSVVVDNDIYPTDTGSWFEGLSNCTSMDLAKLHTDNVTNMSSMFNECSSLTSLDLSNFNTSNVTSMEIMFMDCSALQSIDLSNFNTANVESMAGMFSSCESLTSLNLSNFNTTKVTDMGDMFSSCSLLSDLDLSSFDTSNSDSLDYMLNSCNSLKTLKTPAVMGNRTSTLPITMYDNAGNEYTSLVANKSLRNSVFRGIVIQKNITAPAGANIPAATYNFNVAGVTVADGTTIQDGTVNLYTGITEGLTQPTISFANNQTSNTADLDFSEVNYPSSGAYRYTLSEVAGSTACITYDNTIYTIDVYVGYPDGSATHTANDLQVLQTVVRNAAEEKVDAVFNNTFATKTLTLEKKVSGSQGDYEKDFDFNVLFAADNALLPIGSNIVYTLYNADGSTSTGNFTLAATAQHFALGHGDKVVFENIPQGVSYTITESVIEGDGYDVSHKEAAEADYTDGSTFTKTMDADGDSVTFLNNRDFISPTGVALTVAPFIVLVAFAGVLLLKKRKPNNA